MAATIAGSRTQSRFATTDDKDPDRIVSCPYDDVHLVGASRMARHLIKCRKNHPSSNYKTCCFNAQHVVFAKEYEYHINTCPDKRVIKQDTEKDSGVAFVLPMPERNDHLLPECDEDWDADATAAPFISSAAVASSGQWQMTPGVGDVQSSKYGNQYGDQYGFDDAQDTYEEDVDDLSNQFSEIEVPEKPCNWDSMTQVQRKNHKRKYRRQQERLKEAGLQIVNSDRSNDPEKWTEAERDIKLKSICSKYAIPGKGGGSFQDYKSILNQYCQKNRLNIPIYKEVSSDSRYGGFASECIVKSDVYRSHGYFNTKKDAGHGAAMWALLSLEINDGDENGSKTVRVSQMGADNRVRREGDETRRLLAAGYIGATAKHQVLPANHSGSASRGSGSGYSNEEYYSMPQEQDQTTYSASAMMPSSGVAPGVAAVPPNPHAASPWNSAPLQRPAPPSSQPSAWNMSHAPSHPPQTNSTTWNAARPTSSVKPPPGFPALPTPSNMESSYPPLDSYATHSSAGPAGVQAPTAADNNSWQSVTTKKRPAGRGRGTTLAKSVY